MKNPINNRSHEELNVIRDIIKMDHMIQAFLLISQVRQAIEKGNAAGTPEELYTLLLMAADKKGIQNPFSDSDQFYRVFSNVTGQIPWEQALMLDFKNCKK